MNDAFLIRRNAEPARLADVPLVAFAAFRDAIIAAVEEDCRVVSFFARPANGSTELVAVVADDATSELGIVRTRLTENRFESLTPACPQLQLFEREIAEEFGIEPVGHPWLKPVRFLGAPRGSSEFLGLPRGPISESTDSVPGAPRGTRGTRGTEEPRNWSGGGVLPGVTNFFRVEGEEVHEVAVGPVHAGVIEPGHFRFQCHGEHVFHLEIALGYQHRGIERALIGGPTPKSVHYVETIAGDTTIGHTLAYAQALEALSGTPVPARAHVLRGIALELERLANHTGDLGALSGDVAYLPTASYCGRTRGDFLNLTAELCGSRFGRGFVRPGGVRFDLEPERIGNIAERLAAATKDTVDAVSLLWGTPSVMERFEGTGTVEPDVAEEIGVVGVAARACGHGIDVRHDFPFGIYRFVHIPVMTAHHGDVNSRAFVRFLEVQRSSAFVAAQLKTLPSTAVKHDVGAIAPDSIVVSMTEGWRGEICHVAITDGAGRFARYKITDPSFHNWFALALALRGGQISDFPLCNKSFNLSYCGHDL